MDEADVDDRKDILSLSSLFSSTYDTLLFALQSDCQMITVYMFAIYPIYTSIYIYIYYYNIILIIDISHS